MDEMNALVFGEGIHINKLCTSQKNATKRLENGKRNFNIEY